MSWLASSISPPPRSRRRIIHPWRPNPERSCICSTLALRALFVTFFLAVISRDGTMDDRQTRGKGGRRDGDPISSRTDNYNSATTSSRLFGGGEATTSSSSYDKFTDFVGSENRDHRMQGVQKRQRENAIAVPGDEKGPGRDEQGGTYLARRVPENNKVRRVGFDCSRILDENGLVRYYWDFPFQDSDGNMNLRSRLTYFGMGWVGWGIPLASTPPDGFLATGFVEGTDVVIGLSDLPRSRTNPGRYSIDGPSLADVNLLPDRAQTLREASVRQTRRRSEMTFTYVMNGAMSNPVNVTGENTIVWAYGFSNVLGHNGDELGSHRDRDSYLIDFSVCSETAAPSPLPPPPPPPPPPSPEIEESVSPSTSFVPSRTPSLMPSVSAKPSRSLRPSSLFLPSAFPSVSSAPSSKPSSAPSSEPSSAPSNVPSNAPTRSYDHEIIVDEKNLVRFAWDTPIDSGNGVTVLSARLSYLGRGWVGWGTPKVEGSDSSSFTKRLLQVSEGFIIDSVAVIGLPDEPIGRQNPGLYSVQNITASGIVLLPTAEQLLQTASIKQSGNATVMTFSKVLNLTTTHPVSIAGDNVFTYTFGLNNTIESLEGWRTFRVDLTDPTKSTPRPSLSPRPSGSMVPSQSPRPSQKYQPSAAPSKSARPSANPSNSPSQKPSRAPSASPSSGPSKSPTSK